MTQPSRHAPSAPTRDDIARIIFAKSVGMAKWDNEFYTEERFGCLDTADAILAAFGTSDPGDSANRISAVTSTPKPDPFDLCVMIVEEECYLDNPDSYYRGVGLAIQDRIRCAQRDRQSVASTTRWPTADLREIEQALEQAQDCIRGETPEDMTHEEAREDTISKVRSALRTMAAFTQADGGGK